MLGKGAKAKNRNPAIYPADAEFEREASKQTAAGRFDKIGTQMTQTKSFYQRKAELSALHADQKVPDARAMVCATHRNPTSAVALHLFRRKMRT